MTETKTGNQSLLAESAEALRFFGLTLSEAVRHQPVDRFLLKNDAQSQVLRLPVYEQSKAKTVVIKRQRLLAQSWQEQSQRLNESAQLEHMLSAAAAASTNGRELLFPRQKYSHTGKPWLVFTKSGRVFEPASKASADHATAGSDNNEDYPASYVSVSEFLPNSPVFDWLHPPPPEWQNAHAYSAGAILAKLHCAGYQAMASEEMAAFNGDSKSALCSKLPLIKRSLSASFSLVASTFACNQEEPQRCEQALDQALANLISGADARVIMAEATIVHGDFHPGNVLFQGSNAIALIDLDYAHLEHPLYDIAYACLMFAPGAAFQDRADALLDGYKSYYAENGLRLPSFLPEADWAMDSSTGLPPVLKDFLKVSAYLTLLWLTQIEENARPSGALDLTRRLWHIIVA